MAAVDDALAYNREAVELFVRRAEEVPADAWARPRAPGKWSPAQVTEHVAISYEVSRRVITGETAMGGLPRFLRPLVRALFFKRMLATGKFPGRTKTSAAFEPSATPPNRPAGLARLGAALTVFEEDVRRQPPGTPVEHPVFGRLALADYVRFAGHHTRHHEAQLGP